MNLYNQFEQLVSDTVDQLFDELIADGSSDVCDCRQCRLDVACYALNRLPPRYIVSERGFTHMEATRDIQERADLIALVNEGIERVSTTRRPGHNDSGRADSPARPGPSFDFPVITGRVLEGTTFEPISAAEVAVIVDGIPAAPHGPTWRNPLELTGNALGRYSIWPGPLDADAIGVLRRFAIIVSVSSPGHEPLDHRFTIDIESAQSVSPVPKRTHEIEDLYLFCRETGTSV